MKKLYQKSYPRLYLMLFLISSTCLAQPTNQPNNQSNDDIYQLFDNYNGRTAQKNVQPSQPIPNGASAYSPNFSSSNNSTSGQYNDVFSNYDYLVWQKKDDCDTLLPTNENFQDTTALQLTMESSSLTKYQKSFHAKATGLNNQPINFVSYSFYFIDGNDKIFKLPNIKYNPSTGTFYALSLVPTVPNTSCLTSGTYTLLFHAKDTTGKYYNYKANVSFTDDPPEKILNIIKATPITDD